MSRLQIGGFALVIKAKNPLNLGTIVEITGVGKNYDWIVEGDLNANHAKRKIVFKICFEADSDQLMPIGDKYTQDLLSKEEKSKNESS